MTEDELRDVRKLQIAIAARLGSELVVDVEFEFALKISRVQNIGLVHQQILDYLVHKAANPTAFCSVEVGVIQKEFENFVPKAVLVDSKLAKYWVSVTETVQKINQIYLLKHNSIYQTLEVKDKV